MRVNIEDTRVDRDQMRTYNGELYTGEVVRFDEDGVLVELLNFTEGVSDGPQREWYDDGTRRSEYDTVDGSPRGVSLDWHPNGRLARRQEFDEFGTLRKREMWDEDGVLEQSRSVDTW